MPESAQQFEMLPLPGTLVEALDRMVDRRSAQVAVRSHDHRVSWTWRELADRVDELARGFHALGLRRGDTAALLLRNRPEFYALDMALVRLGVVPFSLYATSSPEQQAHALTDSGARVVVAEPGLMPTLESVPLPELRYQVDGDCRDGWSSIDEVVEKGRGVDISDVARPEPDDLLTLIYTSGTTGPPKGVMISHRNFLATAEATLLAQRIPEGTTVVSWLPAAHVGERIGGYVIAIVQGFEVVTVPDPRVVVDALPDIRPGYFFAPPRVFEKLRSDFDTWLLGLAPEEAAVVRTALERSLERVRLEQERLPVPDALREETERGRAVTLLPWKRKVGLDRLRVAVVATAPNPGPIMEFFHAIGVPMGEAYGLSESGASGTASAFDNVKIGTVGLPSRNMELRLADDGEILLRGPAVMVGYWGKPEATAAVIDAEGWLHSGDLGELDDEGFLKVIGRKKELIISSSGKNIAPVAVEAALISASPLIAQACCVGDARPYNVALVVLDADYGREWAKSQGMEIAGTADLARHPLVREEVERAVGAANARLNRPEQIKRFHVVEGDWLPGRELTATSKMRRTEITRLYSDVIEELYA